MSHQSLFGHLATTRFSGQTEDLATEGLNYILNQSPVARKIFLRYLRTANIDLPESLTFRTQAYSSGKAKPDLVGSNVDGQTPVIVESKFWAGLTDNQPLTYLQRLPVEQDGILLFLAPAVRFPTLWPELLRRCRLAEMEISPTQDVFTEFKVACVNGCHLLGLASWRSLLNFLLDALTLEGEVVSVADVRQLLGLADQMDTKAFIPLDSAELSANIGKRIVQYCDLVDALLSAVNSKGWATSRGYRSTGLREGYRQYMTFVGRHNWFIQFHADSWARFRETPLWLGASDLYTRPLLFSLEQENPPRLIVNNKELLIPLYLPLGVERAHVIDNLCAQVGEVAELLTQKESS
jgi:hypothetical protein